LIFISLTKNRYFNRFCQPNSSLGPDLQNIERQGALQANHVRGRYTSGEETGIFRRRTKRGNSVTERRFDIVFSGKLINGAETLEVKENLRRLFKLDPDAVEKLFSGNPMVIKTNVDRATATKYQQAITQAGATIQLRLHQAQEPDTAAGKEAAGPVEDSGIGLLPLGSAILAKNERQEFRAVEIDTSHLQLDEITPLNAPGQGSATFGEPLPSESRYPGSITDTSIQTALTLLDSSAPAPTSDRTELQAADIDIEHLSTATADGYLLDENERPKFKKVEVDTSALSLSDN